MADDLTVGAVIAGRYRLERLLAEGGMGVVWAAKHLVTRKPVALKFVKGEAANDERTRRRLLREARAACAVQHPNVVAVHDVMELESGSPVLVMDLLKGESLRAKLDREGRIPLHDLANILIPVVSAVGTAHSCGVVHRDLKPENIFLAQMPGGAVQVKVLDFGIAKLTSTEGLMAQSGALTGTGLLLGTPDYMSVEQILGEEDVDHRADIWALGIVLYECLDGHRPTAADNVGKVLKIILTNAILPIAQVMPNLPEDIKVLIQRMLMLDRGARPADLHEVGRILERYGTVPLLPFEKPRSRSLSEAPPVPPLPLPSIRIAPPPMPRLPGDSSRTLGPGNPPHPEGGAPPPAKTTQPEHRRASAMELADTTIARPPSSARADARAALAARPLAVPPSVLGGRDGVESGMNIALDEPFATEGAPSERARESARGKSLTLGDLLSPDELAMLGERLERAQSVVPAAPAPHSPVAASFPAAPEAPASEDDEPIASTEILPASMQADAFLPNANADDDDEEPASSEQVTLVGRRPLPPRPEGDPHNPAPPDPGPLGAPRELTDTLPVPFRVDDRPAPPALPFAAPAAGARAIPQQPHRLSFSDPGGSKEYPSRNQGFGDPGVPQQYPFTPAPPHVGLRSSEVQTPHSTTAPTPQTLRALPPPQRRGMRVAAIAALVGFAILATWLLMKAPPEPNDAHPPVDTASTAPTQSAPVPAPLSACPSGMALITGAEPFAMGTNDGQAEEKPLHDVLVQSFCLDLTEVTGAAYLKCVDGGHCEPLTRQVSAASTYRQAMTKVDRTFESSFCQEPRRDGAKNLPINCVNWTEATTYCRVQGKRLPTEDEWEYASRGGAEWRLFPWGPSAPTPKLANGCGAECSLLYERAKQKKKTIYPENDGHASLAPVGSFVAGDSRHGVHDLAGNVWEWTASPLCHYPSHSCNSPHRVFRGGGWVNASPSSFWGATRNWGSPENRYMDVGFRCAKDKG